MNQAIQDFLQKHQITDYVELDNDGAGFVHDDHTVEIYAGEIPETWDASTGKKSPPEQGFVFAYNSDPPEDGCWEFAYGSLADFDKHLAEPEALWSW